MWSPLTTGVRTTHDIIWLRRIYYSKDIGYNVVVEPLVLDVDMVENIQLLSLVYCREGRMETISLLVMRQLQWTTFGRWTTWIMMTMTSKLLRCALCQVKLSVHQANLFLRWARWPHPDKKLPCCSRSVILIWS
jgi:hypothetical protein